MEDALVEIVFSMLIASVFVFPVAAGLYLMYSSLNKFIREKKYNNIGNEKNNNSGEIVFTNEVKRGKFRHVLKFFMLFVNVVIYSYFIFIVNEAKNSTSSEGGMILMFAAPFLTTIFFFYPIYFVTLAFRFRKEKEKMHPIDLLELFLIPLALGYIIIFFIIN